jgi:Domain of unknown function (DUF222)/HNH endonuclease
MISGTGDVRATAAAQPAAASVLELRDAIARLARQDGAGLGEAELIEQVTAMEELKSALAAAQARVTVTLASRRSGREAAAGVRADQRCRGLASEVGLARHESPVRGQQHLGLAKALVGELPCTLAALTRGEISEWRATLIARETAVLSGADRAQVDAELAGRMASMGDRRVAAEARAIGYRLDPGSATRRVRGAHADRRVGLRPAPDTMSYLTGFLPVAHGVACRTALSREADSRLAEGDPRTRGQIMADTLVARITGQTAATGTPVEIDLVVTAGTLLGGEQTPGHLGGYGPIPASLARGLVRDADKAWVRRLFTRPTDGALVAMDSRRRCFDGELRRFLVLRDQTCRNTWCDAPVRHTDHVVAAARGGPTSADNGQGLCETCNQTKEAPGWTARRVPGRRHRVEITTPTGHRYVSTCPDPPRDRPRHRSPLEEHVRKLVA